MCTVSGVSGIMANTLTCVTYSMLCMPVVFGGTVKAVPSAWHTLSIYAVPNIYHNKPYGPRVTYLTYLAIGYTEGYRSL